MKQTFIPLFSFLGWLASIALIVNNLNIFSLFSSVIFFIGFVFLWVDKKFPYRFKGIVSSILGIIIINSYSLTGNKIHSLVTENIFLAKRINVSYLDYSIDLFSFFIASLWIMRLYGYIPIISIIMIISKRNFDKKDIFNYPYKFWWFVPGVCFFVAVFFFYRSFQ